MTSSTNSWGSNQVAQSGRSIVPSPNFVKRPMIVITNWCTRGRRAYPTPTRNRTRTRYRTRDLARQINAQEHIPPSLCSDHTDGARLARRDI